MSVPYHVITAVSLGILFVVVAEFFYCFLFCSVYIFIIV